MSKIRVAIGGQGRSGYNIHTRHLIGDERYELVAIADQLEERREHARSEHGLETYDDWRALLDAGGFDLFVNALPSPLHVEATIAAFNKGYHVVCEKPAARTVADYDRVMAAATKAGRVLAPFQNNRPQPFFDKIQEIIASGVIGRLVHIRSNWAGYRRRWDWQTRQDLWGGSLLNTGPHAVDQALCLFGWERTPEVFCRMDCRNPFEGDAENHITMTLWDPERQGPQIDIDISSMRAYPEDYTYNISGEYGAIVGGARKLTWKYFDPSKAPKHDMWLWSEDRQYPREELDWTEEEWTLDQAQTSGAVGYTLESLKSGPERIYANVADAIGEGAELLITPEQIRKQVAVMEECHRQNPLPRKPQSLPFTL